ncbi:MAG: radical SAM protein [Desulfobacterales bacterium]|nr:radical SAM protein [Desulfobacterales bacterium]
MKICLVCHKYDVALDDPCCYPLGFMYVSSTLKLQGHEVKVLNYNLWDYDFIEEVKDQDVVCFTGFEEFAKSIVRDATLCKEMGIWTVLGGALATYIPEVMGKYVDQIIVGEFEETSNIDDFPLPDYEGFGVEEYHKRHSLKYMGVLTSRGCPHSCTFCTQICKFRVRSLGKVFGEIEYYKRKYEIESIVFNDNTLNLSKSRFMKICNWMKGKDLEWGASIRCEPFDEEMVKAAKESNCNYFVVGVESFNQVKLDAMSKGIKAESIINTLDLLHKYDISYHSSILVGFENESYEDITTEISLIPRGYNVFPALVQPFVGTKDGKTRLITEEQEEFLDLEFGKYIEAHGMYQFPALKSCNERKEQRANDRCTLS